MTRISLCCACALIIAACSAPNSPEAIGEYNLSKGKCTNIKDNARAINDKMTQDVCKMVEGEFVPRNHKKRAWF